MVTNYLLKIELKKLDSLQFPPSPSNYPIILKEFNDCIAHKISFRIESILKQVHSPQQELRFLKADWELLEQLTKSNENVKNIKMTVENVLDHISNIKKHLIFKSKKFNFIEKKFFHVLPLKKEIGLTFIRFILEEGSLKTEYSQFPQTIESFLNIITRMHQGAYGSIFKKHVMNLDPSIFLREKLFLFLIYENALRKEASTSIEFFEFYPIEHLTQSLRKLTPLSFGSILIKPYHELSYEDQILFKDMMKVAIPVIESSYHLFSHSQYQKLTLLFKTLIQNTLPQTEEAIQFLLKHHPLTFALKFAFSFDDDVDQQIAFTTIIVDCLANGKFKKAWKIKDYISNQEVRKIIKKRIIGTLDHFLSFVSKDNDQLESLPINLNKIFKLIKQLPDKNKQKNDLCMNFCLLCLKKEDDKTAFKASQLILNVAVQSIAMAAICDYLIKQQKYKKAFQTALSISDYIKQSFILKKISFIFLKLQRRKQALEVLTQMIELTDQMSTISFEHLILLLENILDLLVEIRDREGIISMIQLMNQLVNKQPDLFSNLLLTKMTTALCEIQEWKEAKKVVAFVSNEKMKLFFKSLNFSP